MKRLASVALVLTALLVGRACAQAKREPLRRLEAERAERRAVPLVLERIRAAEKELADARAEGVAILAEARARLGVAADEDLQWSLDASEAAHPWHVFAAPAPVPSSPLSIPGGVPIPAPSPSPVPAPAAPR